MYNTITLITKKIKYKSILFFTALITTMLNVIIQPAFPLKKGQGKVFAFSKNCKKNKIIIFSQKADVPKKLLDLVEKSSYKSIRQQKNKPKNPDIETIMLCSKFENTTLNKKEVKPIDFIDDFISSLNEINVDNKTQFFQMLQTTLNNHNFALYDQALNRLIHNKNFYRYMIHSFYTYIMSISKTKSNCDLIESLFTILTNKTLKIICEYVYFYAYKEDVNNNKITFFVKTPEIWSIIKDAANNNGGSMLSFSCLDLNKKDISEMFYAPEFGTLISIVLPNLEYLNMTKMNLKMLPKWIGDLRCIKYFFVSLNPLKKLPKSINNLGMLKTVVLPCLLRNTVFSENLKKKDVRVLFVNETLSKENNSVELEGNGDFVSPLVLKNKNDF